MITISYMNFWTDPVNDKYFSDFIHNFTNCTINHICHTNHPDILICSCVGNINNIIQTKAKVKLFFYGENLERYPPYNNFELLKNTFDLIIGFKKSNILEKQVQFPLWLIYYPFYSWDEENNILKYIEYQHKNNRNKTKNKLATIVSRHDRNGSRTLIWKIIGKYGKVYSGGAFKSNVPLIGTGLKAKQTFISESYFNICPENSIYEDYITEKIFQALEGGTIPLYWGSKKPEIINDKKYCYCPIDDINQLENNIKYAVENKDKILAETIFSECAKDTVKEYYDFLRESLKNVFIKKRVL